MTMPTTAIATAAPISAHSVLCAGSAAPPVTTAVAGPTTGSSQCSSTPTGPSGSSDGRLSQPPNALNTPNTTSGPVMTHGASARCDCSVVPLRFGPWNVYSIIRVM